MIVSDVNLTCLARLTCYRNVTGRWTKQLVNSVERCNYHPRWVWSSNPDQRVYCVRAQLSKTWCWLRFLENCMLTAGIATEYVPQFVIYNFPLCSFIMGMQLFGTLCCLLWQRRPDIIIYQQIMHTRTIRRMAFDLLVFRLVIGILLLLLFCIWYRRIYKYVHPYNCAGWQ